MPKNSTPNTTPTQDPDLVDRVVAYLRAAHTHRPMTDADWTRAAEDLRKNFGGAPAYIRKRAPHAPKILALFNGRNANEVARKLGISRATVYRQLKQPGPGL